MPIESMTTWSSPYRKWLYTNTTCMCSCENGFWPERKSTCRFYHWLVNIVMLQCVAWCFGTGISQLSDYTMQLNKGITEIKWSFNIIYIIYTSWCGSTRLKKDRTTSLILWYLRFINNHKCSTLVTYYPLKL